MKLSDKEREKFWKMGNEIMKMCPPIKYEMNSCLVWIQNPVDLDDKAMDLLFLDLANIFRVDGDKLSMLCTKALIRLFNDMAKALKRNYSVGVDDVGRTSAYIDCEQATIEQLYVHLTNKIKCEYKAVPNNKEPERHYLVCVHVGTPVSFSVNMPGDYRLSKDENLKDLRVALLKQNTVDRYVPLVNVDSRNVIYGYGGYETDPTKLEILGVSDLND